MHKIIFKFLECSAMFTITHLYLLEDLYTITFYYINTNEIPSQLSRENLISSHVKITLSSHVKTSSLLWLHNKPYLSDQKTI